MLYSLKAISKRSLLTAQSDFSGLHWSFYTVVRIGRQKRELLLFARDMDFGK